MINKADPILYLGGVKVKEPSSITIQRNKLWSQGSGRSRSGNFCGKVQTLKYRIDVQWSWLTEAEAAQICALLEPDYIDVKFRDPKTKQMKTIRAYAGDEVYSVYNYAIEKAVYEGLPISLVEK